MEKDSSRLTNEVFSRPAPEVLELHAYLNQKSKVDLSSSQDATLPEAARQCEQPATCSHAQEPVDLVKEIPEEEIIRDRLSLDEIRKLPCGKFANYSAGNPSHVLYIKNLSRDVTEADLVALFVRYQGTQQPLLFRLMKQGRMKGQAFVTFSDVETSSKALQLLNGYKLKGKPMVIEFGHGKSRTSCNVSEQVSSTDEGTSSKKILCCQTATNMGKPMVMGFDPGSSGTSCSPNE